MAFDGYLLQTGSYDTFFNSYIVAASYKVAKKVLDVDSYRDANGVLHRNAMPHLSYNIEFNIKPLDNTRLETFMSALRENFTVSIERKLSLTFYVPEDNAYDTTDVYMPDIDFQINHIEGNVIKYYETTIKFIGY